MPELPEVQTIVVGLRRPLVGAIIADVRLRRRDIVRPRHANLPAALRGQIIRAIDRRGKYILIRFASGSRLAIHLGMTGRLTVHGDNVPLAKHTHLVLSLWASGKYGGMGVSEYGGKSAAKHRPTHPHTPIPPHSHTLRFTDPRRFGRIRLLPPGESLPLGPEPFGLRPAQLYRRLARTRRAIKTALLDQKLIAGLGNIYADESLFASGIDPRTPASRLSLNQARRLNRAVKMTLRRAIGHRGSTLRDYVDAQGEAGAFQELHNVYGRAGLPCRACSTPVRRLVLGGRSTHFCPRCQA
jgi:formamidopyrimidine-DNA glycosylase